MLAVKGMRFPIDLDSSVHPLVCSSFVELSTRWCFTSIYSIDAIFWAETLRNFWDVHLAQLLNS